MKEKDKKTLQDKISEGLKQHTENKRENGTDVKINGRL